MEKTINNVIQDLTDDIETFSENCSARIMDLLSHIDGFDIVMDNMSDHDLDTLFKEMKMIIMEEVLLDVDEEIA